VLKNQVNFSSDRPERFLAEADYAKLEKGLPPELGKFNHGQFSTQLATLGEGKLHGLVGYLYAIEHEKEESSNCQLPAGPENTNVDFHIWIGFDEGIAAKLRGKKKLTPKENDSLTRESAIVEMTPHYRARFHPEWTLEAIRSHVGEQVRVVGQLMVDNEHNTSNQNCGRADAKPSCWRMSVWELHPVTEFQFCRKADGCSVTAATDWLDVDANGENKVATGTRPPKPNAEPQ